MEVLRPYVPLVGRLLFALPFLNFGLYKLNNWEMMRGWLEFKAFPAPGLMLGAAIAIELVGGLMLIAGFRVRWTAVVLALYLLPVHFRLHDFWTLTGAERQSQLEQFLKGFMIIGGLLFVLAHGAGPMSVDASGDRSARQ